MWWVLAGVHPSRGESMMSNQGQMGEIDHETIESSTDDTEKIERTETSSGRGKVKLPVSRRNTLLTILGLGGLGTLSGPARAGHGGSHSGGSQSGDTRPWRKDVDAQGHDLFNLGSLAMANNATAITDFEGNQLIIDDNGLVNVDDGPGSGLDADTLDGLELAELEQRISDLEDDVGALENFVESTAANINSILVSLEEFVNTELIKLENTLNGGLATIEGNLNTLGGALDTIFNQWVADMQPAFDYLSDASDGLVDAFNSAADDIENNVNTLIGLFNNQLDAMAGDIEGAIDDLSDALQDVDNVVNTAINSIENAVNSLSDTAEGFINDTIIDALNKLSFSLDDVTLPNLTLPNLNLSSISVTLPSFSVPTLSLPRITVPDVDLPTVSIPEFELPRISFATLSLGRLDEDVGP